MTESNNNILPQHFIKVLYECFLDMENACIKVKTAVRSSGNNFPVYVPTYSDNNDEMTSELAREAALKSITQLFHTHEGEHLAEAGILCSSSETVTTIVQLNTAKNAFKKAIMSIREYQKDENVVIRKIDKLINDELLEKGRRTDELTQAMGTAGIRSLDLKRCYAKIRIIPQNLDVFSWTWAVNHSRIKKVTLTDALVMARSLPDDAKREIAMDILSNCTPNEVLVRKIGLPNQLRANYAYKEDGKLIRKSCPVSGVVIAQQATMPRMLWRENPEISGIKPERLPRVSGIENVALVHSLSLYRYVK